MAAAMLSAAAGDDLGPTPLPEHSRIKMRELRGAGVVTVRHIAGVSNPADIFTKVLPRPSFEQHRKTVLNLSGDTGVEHARRVRLAGASSLREGTRAT